MPAFLRRLVLPEPGPPSVAGLRLLHRAYVERVPYENLDIQLQRPTAGPADFTAMHEYLSTSPDSGFVRTAVVQRRDATGVDQVRGCVLSRVDGAGVRSSELTTRAEWFGALADVFGLTLDDLDPAVRDVLWRRVRAAHEAWRAEPAA